MRGANITQNNPSIKRNVISKEQLVTILLGCFIIVVRLYHLPEITSPFLFEDEMGYWSHAANLAGMEWHDSLKLWYSYGYSLILFPLFFFTHSMQTMYRTAIIINAMFGVFGFCIGLKLIADISPRTSWGKRGFISFLSSCFSAYVFQSYIGWAETTIYTVFLFIVWRLERFFRTKNTPSLLIAAISILYLYIVHNRTITVMAAFLIIVGIMIIRKQLEWKHVALVVAVFTVGIIVNHIMRQHLTNLMYTDVEMVFHGNDTTTVVGRYAGGNIAEDIFYLFLSLLDKIWASMAETLLLSFFAVIFMIRKAWESRGKQDGCFEFYIFLLLTVFFSFSVTSIAMNPFPYDTSNIVRIDVFYYCRYADMLCGLFIIMGFLELGYLCSYPFSARNKVKEVMIGAGLFCVLSGLLHYQLKPVVEFWNNYSCVPGLLFFRRTEFSVLRIFVVCELFVAFYLIVIIIRKPMGICFLTVGVLPLFLVTAENGFLLSTKPSHIYYESEIQPIVSFLNNCSSVNEIVLYGFGEMGDSRYNSRQMLRMNILNKKVTYDKIDVDRDNVLIVLPKEDLVALYGYFSNAFQVSCEGSHQFMVVGFEESIRKELELEGLTCTQLNLDEITGIISYDENDHLLISGWYPPNTSHYYWSSKEASLYAYLEKEDCQMILECGDMIPFEGLATDAINIEVMLNGRLSGNLSVNADTQGQPLIVQLDKELIKHGYNEITLSLDKTWSPSELGADDTTQYGFSLWRIRFKEP